MEIKTKGKHCIITPLSPKLGLRESSRIFDEIKEYSSYVIGLDLSFVRDCTIDFIEEIKKHTDINIFNIPSDIFVLFNCMSIDKIVNLYASEMDFKNSAHRLLNRQFCLVR